MCSSSAPAPDPGIGQAAQQNAQIAADTLAWYKEKDLEMKPARDKAIQMALSQAQIQTDTAAKQNAMADETYEYTKGTFRPLEQKIAADALGYDTPARRDAEAAQSQADLGTAADAARANTAREVASRGGDINSGNYAASLARTSVAEAAMKAAGGNQARKNVEAIGAAKLADAANLGRGIASTNATQTQLGLSAGNSAVGNAQVPGNISAQQSAQYGQGAGLAMQGNSSSGNLLLGQYQAQNAAAGNNDSLWGAVGKIGGSLIAASDENIKEDVKPVATEMSLAAIKKLPVKSWKYREDSAPADGGKTHVGPMAQDVQASLGDQSAPGGKVIDLISLSGHHTGAIKELDKRVMSLENARPRASRKHASRK